MGPLDIGTHIEDIKKLISSIDLTLWLCCHRMMPFMGTL